MAMITMSSKGQLVLPKAIRDRLKLTAGTRIKVTVDADQRVILTPELHEPEELFANRPPVKRVVSVEEMDQAIAKAARGRV
jgi:antitoxin PrlF